MPRDLSGNMTLVTGNPVTTGTAISSAVMNSTLTDLAAEIQDSLSRSGKGGMTAAFKNADGTEAAPGASFTNETSTGWFRSTALYGAGVVRMAIQGAWKFAYSVAGFAIRDSTGTKAVTLNAPAALAADITVTLPPALPGSTLPVTMTSAGALATAQLVNAQQNFGTPSAATDVATKGYVDGLIRVTNRTQITISGANTSATWVHGVAGTAYYIVFSPSAITGAPAAGAYAGYVTKSASQIQLTLTAAPGVGTSITYDVLLLP